MSALDRRLNAWRPELADNRLRGKVEAERFVAGEPARVDAAVADLRAAPGPDAPVDSQLLCGDDVLVFERQDGWAWVQAVRDGYVGYTPEMALGAPGPAATHVVHVPRSFVYPGPDLKFPRAGERSMGSGVVVEDFAETRGTRYAVLASGETMIASHLRSASEYELDHVAVAERLIFTPYLWGGTSGLGVDCSGLVQIAMRMTGVDVLRDTDMQAGTIGAVLATEEGVPDLKRGDLVFWTGHVAIMTDGANAVHASGRAMMVVREPLADAIARIEPVYGRPTVYRRPVTAPNRE